jgi:hypothetical protein
MKKLLSLAWVLLVLNEVRGLIMAAPIIYGLIVTGGTRMALWVAFCSLAGIALSVVVPAYALKRFKAS